jgi:hypothetical protein
MVLRRSAVCVETMGEMPSLVEQRVLEKFAAGGRD